MTDRYAETDTWPNPPASQQPARPATLAASEASRVLGEGSDAQEAREASLQAEAIRSHRVVTTLTRIGWFGWHCLTCGAQRENIATSIEMAEQDALSHSAAAVMAVADAERNTAYARGYQAAREHWKARAESAEAEVERLTQVVARRKAHAEQAESERDAALVALASQDTYIEEGGLIVVGQLREQRARADAAERARDAALAEVEHLEAVNARSFVEQAVADLARALAVPVTGDTEDASPAAGGAPRPRRYDQCDETCTTDCGHCKGAGKPVGAQPETNTHYAVIATSVPPSMMIVAHGPEEFCRTALAGWVEGHPLGEFEEAEILAKSGGATASPTEQATEGGAK